jgi:Ca-activated chloride channel family protein
MILVLLLLLILASHGFSQTEDTEPSDEEGFRIGVAVDQVSLSVNARSVNGGFVRDLTQDDFKVFENGELQHIVNFYSGEVPVHVVLLIDASGSTRISQGEIRRAAMLFAQSLGEEDQVAVITFNYAPKLILNWTNDMEKVQLALESIYAKGSTVLNDAIYVTFDDLFRGLEGKKAVILLTDGVDTGSMVSFEESMELALSSEAMVYVVSKLDEYWMAAIQARQELSARGRLVPKELKDDYILSVRRSLKRLAELSGGKYLDAKVFASLTDVYAQVAEELKNQYYVSYIPRDKTKNGEWREIDVQVNRGGVVASSRRGYYAGR